MRFFETIFGEKKINNGLNTPDKIYLESYGGLKGAKIYFKRGYVEARKMLEDLGKTL